MFLIGLVLCLSLALCCGSDWPCAVFITGPVQCFSLALYCGSRAAGRLQLAGTGRNAGLDGGSGEERMQQSRPAQLWGQSRTSKQGNKQMPNNKWPCVVVSFCSSDSSDVPYAFVVSSDS